MPGDVRSCFIKHILGFVLIILETVIEVIFIFVVFAFSPVLEMPTSLKWFFFSAHGLPCFAFLD
jgi:hypothetical protein